MSGAGRAARAWERGRNPRAAAGRGSGRPPALARAGRAAGERRPASPPPPPPFPRACLCSWRAGAREQRPARGRAGARVRGGRAAWEERGPFGRPAGRGGRGPRRLRRPLCPSAAWAPRAGPTARPPRPLCLGRWGRCGGRARGPACWVGEGVSRGSAFVARSRHYAGRHFLSDPGEERRGGARRRAERSGGPGRGQEGGRCASFGSAGPAGASGTAGRRPQGAGCLQRPRLLAIAAGDRVARLGPPLRGHRRPAFWNRRRPKCDALTVGTCAVAAVRPQVYVASVAGVERSDRGGVVEL